VRACSLAYPASKAMRHIMTSCGRSGSTIFLDISSLNGTIFGKIVIELQMRVLILSTNLSKKVSVIRRIQRETVIYVKSSLCKLPVILVGLS
jgi:hypothetical protein